MERTNRNPKRYKRLFKPLIFYILTSNKMLVKLKEDGNFIEVYKSKLGYYYSLNSKNKSKKYKREDLIFITYF